MWAQIVNTLLGIWLTAAPTVLGTYTNISDNDHIVGPVIASFAVIAIWEATRVVRLYNIPLGLWLLFAPWILGYGETAAIVNDMTVGIAVIIFSFIKGKREEKFGGGWSAIWKMDSLHAQEARRQPRV